MLNRIMHNRPRWLGAIPFVAVGVIIGLAIAGGGARHDGALTSGLATPAADAAPDAQALGSYADVAEAVMPAVVNISTDKVAETPDWHPFLEDPFFRRFFGDPRDNQGRERIERSLGSGVIVRADGYILTSNHVIERASKIRVIFDDNTEYEAEIVGQDPQTDVALIKIDAEDLPTVALGDSRVLRIGDEVMAVGNPFGLGQTVTLGIVSALGRSINLVDYEDFIQTDASINPGNSGGALVNMSGELVGVNTAILSRSGGSQGVGFAIPSHMAGRIMDMLIEHGSVQRAWLGIQVQNVSQAMSEALDLDGPRGVLVSSVEEDTPAAAAGLAEGDIVLSIDGQRVDSVSKLRNLISLSGVDSKVAVEILRDGKEKTLDVVLGQLPDAEDRAQRDEEEAPEVERIDGVSVRELTDRYRQRFQVEDDVDGVLVVDVDQASEAFRVGLRQGDVIVEVAKETVVGLDDYRRLVKENPDKPVLLRVRRGGGNLFVAVPR